MRLFFILTLAIFAFAMEPFVSVNWLKKHLNEVIIIDVSEPKIYKKAHIPNAINAPISLWREHKDNYLLLRKDALKTIQKLGLNKDTKIVLYSHHSGKDMLKASYIAWALELFDIKNSALLDGGFKAWKRAGFKISKKPHFPTPSQYQTKKNSSLVADKKVVLEKIGKVKMLDARPAIFYFGAKKQKTLKRAGHIPKATSYFWRYSFDEKNQIKPKKLLKKMLIDGLKLNPNKEIITYCTGGLETSMNWYILHRVLGFDKAKLYDASMKQWANEDDTPLTKFRWE